MDPPRGEARMDPHVRDTKDQIWPRGRRCEEFIRPCPLTASQKEPLLNYPLLLFVPLSLANPIERDIKIPRKSPHVHRFLSPSSLPTSPSLCACERQREREARDRNHHHGDRRRAGGGGGGGRVRRDARAPGLDQEGCCVSQLALSRCSLLCFNSVELGAAWSNS